MTAAFIGPGTLTTCTRAGIQNGYELLWALVFAGIATIVLQEMAARLGWVTQSGLGEAIQGEFTGRVARPLAFVLVISAILIGNAAYESGNLAGAAIGIELVFGSHRFTGLLVGCLCLGLLWFGRYQWLERILIGLVIAMSACFLATAIVVQPDITEVLQGFRPRAIHGDNFLTIMGIIGTTVVPYNLFLHASAISKKWKPDASLKDLRIETVVAVVLGIAISMLIVVTSAATRQQLTDTSNIGNAADFAVQLQPLFGKLANILMGVGFFAAGLSSALTAPLAAAFAVRGLFGWPDGDRPPDYDRPTGGDRSDGETPGGERDWRFVAVWALIVLIGIVVGQGGVKLVSVILFAQVSNAIILPFIGIFLFRLANSERVMGQHRNGKVSNVLGAAVLIVLVLLSAASAMKLVS